MATQVNSINFNNVQYQNYYLGDTLMYYVDGGSEYSYLFGFEDINYEGTEDILTDTEKTALEYSISVYNNWSESTVAMGSYFLNDTNLYWCPVLNTKNVTSMYKTFYGCSNLRYVPELDITSLTNISSAFYNCTSLLQTPEWDYSKIVTMNAAFYGCTSLELIPTTIDLSSCTTINNMFRNCAKINDLNIGGDCGNINNVNYAFLGCTSLYYVTGFTNLGKGFTAAATLDLSAATLYEESPKWIANSVYDMSEKGFGMTIKFSSNTYSSLTDEVKTIFTNKGWTITK